MGIASDEREGLRAFWWLPRTWCGVVVHAASLPLLVGSILISIQWNGRSGAFLFELPLLALLLVGVVLAIRGAWQTVRDPRLGAKVVLWGAVALLVSFGVMRLSAHARTAAFAACGERAQPLIDGLRGWAVAHGAAPASLHELVPDHLPWVPGTGLPGFPKFDYRRMDGEAFELSVFCGSGFDFDRFVYWSSETYPDSMYGGFVQRIGKWAYVHE